MPSQVEAILISTRSRDTPAASYSAISSRPLATVASVSNDSAASISVDTRPGTNLRISTPKAINRLSMMPSIDASGALAMAFSSSGRYSGFCTAFRISDGLVVASCGVYALIDWKSPVSATTVVNCLSCSSWFMVVS